MSQSLAVTTSPISLMLLQLTKESPKIQLQMEVVGRTRCHNLLEALLRGAKLMLLQLTK